MTSATTERFWQCYAALSVEVKAQAKQAYARFVMNPYHPSLQFKRIHPARPIFSVRISIDYPAVGVVQGDEITWFWIGSHAEYDHVVKRLRNV